MKTTIHDFDFEFVSHGHYKVTYTSPTNGKKYSCTTDNMQLIDNTKNSENPKQNELNVLKRRCKNENI